MFQEYSCENPPNWKIWETETRRKSTNHLSFRGGNISELSLPTCCSASRLFCTVCANFSSNARRIHYTAGRKTGKGARRKGEKEEYGLLCAVICCAQPLPPLPHFTCPRSGLSGLEEHGRAPPPPYPYPFWTVWGCRGRSRGRPLIWRSWVW